MKSKYILMILAGMLIGNLNCMERHNNSNSHQTLGSLNSLSIGIIQYINLIHINETTIDIIRYSNNILQILRRIFQNLELLKLVNKRFNSILNIQENRIFILIGNQIKSNFFDVNNTLITRYSFSGKKETNRILTIAVEKNDLKLVKLLIYAGADVNLRDYQVHKIYPSSRTFIESEYNEYDSDEGYLVPIEDYNEGLTALMIAVKNRNKYIVRLLLKNGANVNVPDAFGNTALIMAVLNDKEQKDIVKLLLNYGANVNSKNNMGNTALIIASMKSYKDTVKLLLQNDADVNIQNKWGYAAFTGN